MEFKAKDWTEAKYKLVKVLSGEWEPDRRCAQSTSGGLVVRRFKCKDKGEGLLYLARIINLQGGSWRLQRGIVEDLVEEEPSDSDHDKAEDDDEDDGEAGPSRASERRGTEPPAKKAPRVAPAHIGIRPPEAVSTRSTKYAVAKEVAREVSSRGRVGARRLLECFAARRSFPRQWSWT